jgi:hypothetical protein
MSRRIFLKHLSRVAVGGALAAAAAYGLAHLETRRLVVEKVEVPLKNLNPSLEGFKIVQMSDFHLYPFVKIDFIQEAVSIANRLEPDLAVLTGDFVWRKAEAIFDLAPVLALLKARYGLFTILGNHDLWTDEEIVKAGLTEAGLPLLRNNGQTIVVGQATIYLAGLDDGWSGRPDLNAALEQGSPGALTILLAHEPDLAEEVALDGRVSLQLSGHSHGGQVRLPGIGAPVLPYLGIKYDQGLYRIPSQSRADDGLWLYTNRGLGVIAPPIRVNCPPEITEITLISA